MPAPSSDRNLLFGILALQMDFITQDSLVRALHAWVLAKHRVLGEILVEQGSLEPEVRALIDALVAKHLQQHRGDAATSLAAATCDRPVPAQLQGITDPDLQFSLARLPQPRGKDPWLTLPPETVGLPTSAGGRFRVLRPLDRGGLGVVSVALDTELNREVALKQIKDSEADRPESRARFLLEAEVTGGLEHPGIVPVYGLGKDNHDRPYYAMRFIRGHNLMQAVERFHQEHQPLRSAAFQGVAFRQLLRRFLDVCNAIAYAHERGVLHRDLKPGNVMLGPFGETHVVDWGLAKVLSKQTEPATPLMHKPDSHQLMKPAAQGSVEPTLAGEAVGTPGFMSPEQAAGRLDQLGTASDVYSLGATLYCLLTNHTPVEGNNLGELLRAVQEGRFPRPRALSPAVPPALEGICLKAMALRPAERYPTALALAEDLEHWLADEPVVAHRPALSERLGRWSRRHRSFVRTAVLILALLTLALGVGYALLRQERDATEAARLAEARRRIQAQEALDQMTSQIVEGLLAREPELTPEQRAYVEDVLRLYEQFTADEANASARLASGRAHFRVGSLHKRLGQLAAALAAFGRADELLASLPETAELLRQRARIAQQRAATQAAMGDGAAAARGYQDALALHERLAGSPSASLDDQLDQAAIWQGLGALALERAALEDAETAYRRSERILRGLPETKRQAPQARWQLARTLHGLGTTYLNSVHPRRPALSSERMAQAEHATFEAIQLQTALVEVYPADPGYRFDLAAFHAQLGTVRARQGRLTDLQTAVQEAHRLRERLAEEQPGVPLYASNYALSYRHLGNLFEDIHRPDLAVPAYRRAIELQVKLCLRFLEPEYHQALAATHHHLGRILKEEAKLAASHETSLRAAQLRQQADAVMRASVRTWEQLLERFPTQTLYQAGLARSCVNLGHLFREGGDAAAALPWYDRAFAALDSIRGRKLLAVELLSKRNAAWGKAQALALLGRHADAVTMWELASATNEDLPAWILGFEHAAALARAGETQRAQTALDALALVTVGAEGEYPLLAARAHAALAAALQRSDPARAEQLNQRALALLRGLQQADFFRTPLRAHELQTEPDFAPLRSRRDFMELVAAVREAPEARPPVRVNEVVPYDLAWPLLWGWMRL